MKYAIEIKKKDLGFITMLNGGVTPDDSMTKGKHWFIFEVKDRGGETFNHEIVTERELFQTYELYKAFPALVRLKKK